MARVGSVRYRIVALDCACGGILAGVRCRNAWLDGCAWRDCAKDVVAPVWNHGLLLAAMAKVLVLCCPLLVIAVGIGLIHKAESAQARKFAAKSTQAEEERL